MPVFSQFFLENIPCNVLTLTSERIEIVVIFSHSFPQTVLGYGYAVPRPAITKNYIDFPIYCHIKAS